MSFNNTRPLWWAITRYILKLGIWAIVLISIFRAVIITTDPTKVDAKFKLKEEVVIHLGDEKIKGTVSSYLLVKFRWEKLSKDKYENYEVSYKDKNGDIKTAWVKAPVLEKDDNPFDLWEPSY